MIDFIKDAGMALVWLSLGYFIGESNARKDKKQPNPTVSILETTQKSTSRAFL